MSGYPILKKFNIINITNLHNSDNDNRNRIHRNNLRIVLYNNNNYSNNFVIYPYPYI